MAKTWRALYLSALVLVSGCGGGGSDTANTGSGSGSSTGPATAASLAQICTAGSLYAADASAPTRVGTYRDEQNWVNAYLTEKYLWYRDMPRNVSLTDAAYNLSSADGQSFYYGSSINAYFHALLNPGITASGKKVDAFSFLTSTNYWNSFVNSQDIGYGFNVSKASGAGAGTIYISYVYPGSGGQSAGFLRGDQILSIDGIAASDPNARNQEIFDAYLNPSAPGTHTFAIYRNGSMVYLTATSRVETLKQVESRILTNGVKKVGYMVFNSHVPSAIPDLVAATNSFRQNNIDEMVLDMRYNGGGYIYVASGISYAIAGPSATNGKVFDALIYNDKRSRDNYAYPFISTDDNGAAIPSLGMRRVYVLASGNTCSASEAVVNGLRGVGVDVQLIGGTTCGKPYGYSAQDNCGLTYAAMEFVGYNANGVAVNPDGLTPTCDAPDDLNHPLGDSRESMLSVALYMQQGQTCTQAKASSSLASNSLRGLATPHGGKLLRPDWKNNQFMETGANQHRF